MIKDHWQNHYDTVETVDELWVLFTSRIRRFGFDGPIVFGYVFTQVRETVIGKQGKNNVKKANNFSFLMDIPPNGDGLLEFLLNGNFVHKDPVAYHVKTYGTTAILGIDFLDENMSNYQDAKDFWTATAKFKQRNALAIPFTKNNPFSPHGFALHSTMEPDDLKELVDDKMEEILLNCHQFTPRFNELHRAETAQKIKITKRQMQIMRMVCFGLTNAEMSHLLDITQAAISFHLSAIKEKLTINNNREIPLAAIRLGLVNVNSL